MLDRLVYAAMLSECSCLVLTSSRISFRRELQVSTALCGPFLLQEYVMLHQFKLRVHLDIGISVEAFLKHLHWPLQYMVIKCGFHRLKLICFERNLALLNFVTHISVFLSFKVFF